MNVTGDIAEVRRLIQDARKRGVTIGCVPTMGALHAGHISLVNECRQRVDYCVVTIFVNPTQFGKNEDLSKYPRPLEADLNACQEAGVDCVFTPSNEELYPEGYQSWVTVDGISEVLEGEFRPGHFRGVTTVVAKLFNIVQPDVACFGSKDFQQQAVIRQMVKDLNFATEIVVCKTLRDPDGLAMSSRNVYLSAEERVTALAISRSLKNVTRSLQEKKTPIRAAEQELRNELESTPGLNVQYAVLRDPVTLQEPRDDQTSLVALIAAFVGKTRLIDHASIRLS